MYFKLKGEVNPLSGLFFLFFSEGLSRKIFRLIN